MTNTRNSVTGPIARPTVVAAKDYWAIRDQQSAAEETLLCLTTPKAAKKNHPLFETTIEEVEGELKTQYGLDEEALDASETSMSNSYGPRTRLLLNLRRMLKGQVNKDTPANSTTLANFFQKGKMATTIADTSWGALEQVLPKKIVKVGTRYAAGIVGSLNSLNEIYEGLSAFKNAVTAHRNKKNKKLNKFLFFTSAMRALLAGTCLGLAITFLTSIFVSAITAAALFPVIITLLMTGAGLVKLFYSGLDLHKNKRKEVKYKQILIDYENKHAVTLSETKNIAAGLHQQKMEILQKCKFTTFAEFAAKSNKNREEANAFYHYLAISKKQEELDTFYFNYQAKKAAHRTYKKARIAKERDVAFDVTGTVLSLIGTTGAILGATALLGAATVATLGVLPLALALTGMCACFGLFLFGLVNKHKDFKFTEALRKAGKHFFAKIGQALHGNSNKNSPKKTPTQNLLINESPCNNRDAGSFVSETGIINSPVAYRANRGNTEPLQRELPLALKYPATTGSSVPLKGEIALALKHHASAGNSEPVLNREIPLAQKQQIKPALNVNETALQDNAVHEPTAASESSTLMVQKKILLAQQAENSATITQLGDLLTLNKKTQAATTTPTITRNNISAAIADSAQASARAPATQPVSFLSRVARIKLAHENSAASSSEAINTAASVTAQWLPKAPIARSKPIQIPEIEKAFGEERSAKKVNCEQRRGATVLVAN